MLSASGEVCRKDTGWIRLDPSGALSNLVWWNPNPNPVPSLSRGFGIRYALRSFPTHISL